jgi:hypothetical protein
MQLSIVRCIASFRSAEGGHLARRLQPSLGVSSLDLGRSEFERPFFFSVMPKVE